jgi:hypothetical protein
MTTSLSHVYGTNTNGRVFSLLKCRELAQMNRALCCPVICILIKNVLEAKMAHYSTIKNF